uniref:G-protein coupled receptors family 1 profile domain-containing protein n=1 Tax=Cavia porcellus TaxID=10141 RepID=A0A286Y0Y3_CAVPO
TWPTFSFIGIPGLEAAHMWISIPFCLLYLMAVGGNVLLLILVSVEQNLHEPQFYFLAILALTDLGLSLHVKPGLGCYLHPCFLHEDLGTVMKLGIQDRNWKSLQTCACHLCTVLVFYLPLISLAVLHRYTQETSPILYTIMSNAYVLMTLLLTPLVYSLKSKQIEAALHKRFCVQRVV